jgi:hypothetical protein
MEIYILDTLLRPIDVVDEFVSMIWTERFAEKGDFELVILSTSANNKRFVFDALITINESKRVMKVETIETVIDAEKGYVLKVKGFDLVSALEGRTALRIDGATIYPYWSLTGWTPGELMRLFFKMICVDGVLSADDIIPFIQDGETLYAPDTIVEPADEISYVQKPESLYLAIKTLGDAYDLGFRMYKDPNASKLYFDVYAGSDRTSAQTVLPPVIFSSDMTNLQNTSEFSDNTKHYNAIRVMYVHKDAFDNDVADSVIVTSPDLLLSNNNLERKVKILLVTSIPDDVVDIPAFLTQAGTDELMRSRPTGVFDGEIDKNSNFVYERDYFLGDLVEVRGDNGSAGYMRVVEQIMKEDATGQSSFPSLITNTFINSGTWRSWKYDVEWSAMGSGEYWENQ